MAETIRSKQLELERLTAHLFKLFPGADQVQHDVRKRGKSGILRQIDVLISKKIGPIDFDLLVDTKFKGKKVRRTDVVNVNDIKEDVGAALAIVVAPKGFDRGAKEFAKSNGMHLLNSINTADSDWAGRLRLSAFADIRILAYWVDSALPLPMEVEKRLNEKLSHFWHQHQLPSDCDQHSYSFKVNWAENEVEIRESTVSFMEKRLFRQGAVPLSCFGLFNPANNEFATHGMASDGLRLSHIVDQWEEVDIWNRRALPFHAQLVVRSSRKGKDVDVPFRDYNFKFELLPQNALLDLKPNSARVPFRFSYWPA